MNFDEPVLYMFFNRPDMVLKSFSILKAVKPKKLYLSCDGPRLEVEEEKKTVLSLRKWVISQVDWECSLQTRFLQHNEGCGLAVSHAISWMFEHESRGIILEDDCLPSPAFFDYCKVLLDRYNSDDKIMSIVGSNVFADKVNYSPACEYFYSNFPIMWGWATWKRAWNCYSFEVTPQPVEFYREVGVGGYCFAARFNDFLERISKGILDTWDFQWMMALWHCRGRAITPRWNLVQNIGFDDRATHTASPDGLSPFSILAKYPQTSWAENGLRGFHQKYEKLIVRKWLTADCGSYIKRCLVSLANM